MSQERPRISRPVKTPTVLQMEAVECGAAALGIILEYHGRYVPLDVLRADCGVSRDGSNAYYIVQAARRYNLESKAFRKEFDGLKTRAVPFIVFWRWNHFLVVEGFAHGRAYVNDPASGRRTIADDEFRRSYTGIAMSFAPGPDFVRHGRRPGAIAGLARRLATSRTALAFVILAGLVLIFPNLVAAGFQRIFIDEILIQGRREWLRPLVGAMGLTALIRLAAVSLQQVYLTRLEIRLALSESVRFLQHVLRLPVSFFQVRFAGDIVSRIISTPRLARLISGELATTAVGLLSLVLYVAAMLPYDLVLTATGVAIGSLNLVVLRWMSRWRIDRNRSLEQIRGRLTAGVMWAIQIIETVKSTGAESDLLVRWTGEQARIVNGEQELGRYDSILIVLPGFLATLTTIVVLGLGGYQVLAGTLSIGSLVALQSLLATFNQPFRDLGRLGTELQDLRAEIDRIDDVRNCRIDAVLEAPSLQPGAGARTAGTASIAELPASPPRLSGHLELREVSFGYNRTVEEPLIRDFSLVVRPGQRVALVGGSGSGKSTLARLITGLYEPWSGEILHDGQSIRTIPRELFVNSVALVDERISMFQGSVRDNLTLWDDEIGSDRLVQAGLGAAIHLDLLQRRGGYDAPVAEQARNFSGGQRQRLEIARALVRDPSLLILDEATSALDPRTELLVDDHLRRRGCTCLIIAHRLSTIRDCDEIIVLSAGRVLQRGTHEALIADGRGEYARLLSTQSLPPRRGLDPSTIRPNLPARVLARITRTAAAHASGEAVPPSTPRAPSASTAPDAPSENGAIVAPRFLIEELMPYSTPEQTAANHPLQLDDPDAVWWVSGGQVDVFFALPDPGGGTGRRRHLCRVEEGGSIISISGVRGQAGGILLAVGVGTAQLLKFARGDLIRLSFEENLAEQVALLIDDWIVRVSSPLGRALSRPPCRDLAQEAPAELEAGTRFGVRKGVGWIRHLEGSSLFLEHLPLPATEFSTRFPVTEDCWLTARERSVVTTCDTMTLVRAGDPWAGLNDLHRAVLDDVARIRREEVRESLDELRRSLTREAELVGDFADRLTSVANESAGRPTPADGRHLLTACRAIGRELGLVVRPPRRRTGKLPGGDGDDDSLADVARASGFHLRQVTLPLGWQAGGDGQPLLARLAEDGMRPIALLPSRTGPGIAPCAYTMFDPVDGSRQPVGPDIAGRIAPQALMFYRSLPDHAIGMTDLIHFGLPRIRGELRLLVLLALVCGLLGLAGPVASGILIDQVIPDADRDGPLSPLLVVSAFLAVLTATVAILQVIQGLTVLRIEGKLVPTIVPAIWDRMLRLPSHFFAGYSSGDLALRALGLGEIFKKLSGAAVATTVAGLMSAFNLMLLFAYSWRLALITAVLLAALFLATILLLAGQLRLESSIRKVEGSIIGFLLEIVGGITKLRIAGAEHRVFARWAEKYAVQLELTVRARRFANGLRIVLAVSPLLIAMVVYLGAIQLEPAGLDTGAFFAYTLALANLMSALLAVGNTLISLLDVPPLFERVRPILQALPEFPSSVVEPLRLGGSLALHDVSFHYPGQTEGAKVLDAVSLHARPGEFVAIVGASGSGKSTVLRLLLGFERPDVGTVTYDGRELATLDLREVRRQIGVVLQNGQLTPGDLFTNIVGFAPDLTLEDAVTAARLAGIEDDIKQMPMGMHTLVGEGGGNLSGGQRQRLLIARAIVRRPRILLLDEATSALDNVTQAMVTESITRELRGVTRIVIAHRLNTIVQADRIYVMKDGRVVQVGQYHQLLSEPGPFQELVNRQA